MKTVLNPYSWNTHANIIFLDQPVDVGYSYSDKSKGDSGRVSDSTMAGKDVYAFLQLFFVRFGEYAKAPFHIAAESYGTIYATHFAKEIFDRNQELLRRLSSAPSPSEENSSTLINLASVILANGITDPLVQYPSIADYVCEGPYSDVFGGTDSPECGYVKSKVPVCQRLIERCYELDSEAEESIMDTETEKEKEKKKVEMKRKKCVRAQEYCSTEIEGPLFGQFTPYLGSAPMSCPLFPDAIVQKRVLILMTFDASATQKKTGRHATRKWHGSSNGSMSQSINELLALIPTAHLRLVPWESLRRLRDQGKVSWILRVCYLNLSMRVLGCLYMLETQVRTR